MSLRTDWRPFQVTPALTLCMIRNTWPHCAYRAWMPR